MYCDLVSLETKYVLLQVRFPSERLSHNMNSSEVTDIGAPSVSTIYMLRPTQAKQVNVVQGPPSPDGEFTSVLSIRNLLLGGTMNGFVHVWEMDSSFSSVEDAFSLPRADYHGITIITVVQLRTTPEDQLLGLFIEGAAALWDLGKREILRVFYHHVSNPLVFSNDFCDFET